MQYEGLLFRFTEMSRRILKNNLVGIYLHGSAAMGCFNPKKSDLDLILVVEKGIPNAVKMEFMQNVALLNEEAPEKGIELSIVRKDVCNPFIYPTPFELHFSKTHLKWFIDNPEDYIANMQGVDPDLAAHFTIINEYGIVLFGAEISEEFAKVPKNYYMDSIWFDIENAHKEILTNTTYFTLNLCRVLAYLQDGLILSKKAGGEWGIDALPKRFSSLIQNALICYATEQELITDSEIALSFACYMLSQIKQIRINMDKSPI